MNGESIGFLQIVARTANGALPIENAQINIYEYTPRAEGGERGKIIYTLYTDQDGKSPKVALSTKSKELSMTQGNENPFSVYNIEASKEGFYSNSYINVPIFQGVTAIQPVELTPLIEYANALDDFPSSSQRFVETPNTDL